MKGEEEEDEEDGNDDKKRRKKRGVGIQRDRLAIVTLLRTKGETKKKDYLAAIKFIVLKAKEFGYEIAGNRFPSEYNGKPTFGCGFPFEAMRKQML